MIHAKKLTKYYDDLCAVDQIDFDIEKGEIVGLLGPNGAGKTTTLRMLTGFLHPTSGNIQVKDLNMDESPLEIKKLIGYLPESAPIYHDMITFDYLNYVADIRGLDVNRKIARIRELSGLCGVDEVMHKTIGELSKGYKQRVGLAYAMMDDPEILILDEPTSGLDPNQRVEIRDIIKHIGEEKTVILSTHILSEAEATCDRLLIIDHGKIIVDNSTAELKESALGEIIINISLKNAVFEEVEKSFSEIGTISEYVDEKSGNGVLKLKLKCGTDPNLREEVYRRIKQRDWILLEFYQESQTLEKIFQELTRG